MTTTTATESLGVCAAKYLGVCAAKLFFAAQRNGSGHSALGGLRGSGNLSEAIHLCFPTPPKDLPLPGFPVSAPESGDFPAPDPVKNLFTLLDEPL